MRRAALGRVIRDARTDAGMSQAELATASTTSRATIGRLEAGTGAVSSDVLWELALALGLTPAELFERAQAAEAAEAAEAAPQQ